MGKPEHPCNPDVLKAQNPSVPDPKSPTVDDINPALPNIGNMP